jgi:hypothetical protein
MTTMPRVRDNETGELVYEPSHPAVCIAEAAKEAIDMALELQGEDRDNQLLRAIAQICYLRG